VNCLVILNGMRPMPGLVIFDAAYPLSSSEHLDKIGLHLLYDGWSQTRLWRLFISTFLAAGSEVDHLGT
jgi:hypothetical protein